MFVVWEARFVWFFLFVHVLPSSFWFIFAFSLCGKFFAPQTRRFLIQTFLPDFDVLFSVFRTVNFPFPPILSLTTGSIPQVGQQVHRPQVRNSFGFELRTLITSSPNYWSALLMKRAWAFFESGLTASDTRLLNTRRPADGPLISSSALGWAV
jgi:hypothetical protein